MWMAWLTALAAPSVGDVHDLRHPIGFGVRTGAWAGPYQAPLVGGQIKVRVANWLGMNGFWDNAAMVRGRQVRHDHVIGFNGYFPRLLGGRRAYVSPTLGSCVDFRINTPLDERLPSSNTVLFGVHGGLTGEVALWHRLTFEASAEAFAYLGNGSTNEAWTSSTSHDYKVSGVGQVVAGLSYAL